MASPDDPWIALRRDLHRNPELGMSEVRTKTIVADKLRSFGVDVYEGVGVVGVLKKGSSNRAIGLRADMDALPITENSKHDYVSENVGAMHACGHDGHTIMLLAAAEALSQDCEFDGVVVFLFQPDEEHGTGAKTMIEEGVLDRFPVEEVYAIHNLPGAPLGEVSTRPGLICSSESLFEVSIKGQGGHASMPQVGVDAITVAADMVTSLQTIVARKLAPGAGAVVSITEILTDGQRNVLPGRATLKGEVRARSAEDRERIERLLRQVTQGVGDAHAAEVDLQFETGFIETINAPEPVEAVARVARGLGLPTIADRPPMSFSEDFAHFCTAVPGCFLLMGNGQEGANAQPLHAADYDFNDDLLPFGARFWTTLVQDRLPVRRPE